MKWNLFFRSCIAIAAVTTLWLGMVSPAPAGGGPENVLLVVNNRSWASKTIANHYQSLRKIPDRNIVHIDWKN